MKNRIFILLAALVLCMGAFFMPMEAHAQADTTPPDISVTLMGDMLHIEASDDISGVEAVFIGARCITWDGEDAMDVPFRDYAGTTNRTVDIHAVDAAGNRSGTIEMENPFYEAVVFTPDGQATVLDNATDGDGKEFYTFITPEENVFYLVIDRERDSDNVYFLNAVTEDDLLALAEKDRKDDAAGESAIPEIRVCDCADRCEAGMVRVSCPVCINDLTACLGKEAQQPESDRTETMEAQKRSNGTVIFVFLAVAVVAGAGYYLKIYKPRHDLDDAEDLDDLLDDGDEPEVSEEETDQEAPGQASAWQAETETGDGVEMAGYDGYPDEDHPDDDYPGDDPLGDDAPYDEPGQDRRNDSMALFTDSPYEYLMTQKPTGGRRENAPSPYPPGHECHGCPYGRDRPCLGACIKKLSAAPVREDKTKRRENI